MAQTIISGASAYATSTDLLARYDTRDVAQWVSDTGVPAGSLGTNANLLAALQDASGMVESAAFASNRYSQTDLQNLGNGTTNSSALLKRIVCDIAVGLLIERRPYLDRQTLKSYEMALDRLDQLRKGERIFGFQESADAGSGNVTFQAVPTDIETLNLTTTQAARLFGQRAEFQVPGPNNG